MLPNSLSIMRDLCDEMLALEEQLENVSPATANTRSTFDRQFRLKMLKTKLRMTSPCLRRNQPGMGYHLLPAKLVFGPENTQLYQAYAQVITHHRIFIYPNHRLMPRCLNLFYFIPPTLASRTWEVVSTTQIVLSEAMGLLPRNNTFFYFGTTVQVPLAVGFRTKQWTISPSCTDI